jgi:hypothetical protein
VVSKASTTAREKVPSKASKSKRNNSVQKDNSPKESGEDDFQVISNNSSTFGKSFGLGKGSNHSFGKGSNHSWDSTEFGKAYKGVSETKGSEGTIKDKRRASRTVMAARTTERQSRKSDIFASLDREENEVTVAVGGPLMRKLPTRTKSFNPTAGKTKLMIRPAAPTRSKSMEMALKPTNLKLQVKLGTGMNNKELMKKWEQSKTETVQKIERFDETTRPEWS